MLDSPFGHPAWIEVDLAQFQRNLNIIQNFIAPTTQLCIPVKANAYGHGLIPIARAAVAAGVHYLAVSCLKEGAQLRQAGIEVPILVLGAIHEQQIADLVAYDLEFTIASHYKARLVAAHCQQLGSRVTVHLKVDTGMQRTGVRPETAHTVLDYLRAHDCFEIKGIYSHLARADENDRDYTEAQIARFTRFIESVELPHRPLYHIANSAGMAYYPQSHLDLVRPGLLAFGYFPNEHLPQALQAIKACFSIHAQISFVKTLAAGEGVGYNHSYQTRQQTRMVTLPLGYGDGLRRELSNIGHVTFKGKEYPIRGTICMDQFMVELYEDPAYVGELVTLISADSAAINSIHQISRLCHTIPYEILCGFNNRLPRLYRSGDDSYWESS